MMLNYLWGLMILIGIVYASITGKIPEITEAAMASSKEAITLCITMLGIMALWMGIMEIAQSSGLIRGMTKRLQPVISFLFPNLPKGHPARQYLSVNIIANMLGLGWAATPAGLKAMEALAQLEEERRGNGFGETAMDCGSKRKHMFHRGSQTHAMPPGMASNEMCTFLIINISSLQLIPVNVIAWRSQYGSVNPAAVVGPGIVATAVSTLAAVVFCKVMDGKGRGV